MYVYTHVCTYGIRTYKPAPCVKGRPRGDCAYMSGGAKWQLHTHTHTHTHIHMYICIYIYDICACMIFMYVTCVLYIYTYVYIHAPYVKRRPRTYCALKIWSYDWTATNCSICMYAWYMRIQAPLVKGRHCRHCACEFGLANWQPRTARYLFTHDVWVHRHRLSKDGLVGTARVNLHSRIGSHELLDMYLQIVHVYIQAQNV